MSLIPTTDLVATNWVKSNGFGAVGTQLPEDNTSWAASGFIVVTVVAGTPSIYTRLARPVVQFDCWANNTASAKAPWGKANQLAEMVKDWAWNVPNQGQKLTIGGSYQDARLLSAYVMSEPRRLHDPNTSYAHYTFDVFMPWTY